MSPLKNLRPNPSGFSPLLFLCFCAAVVSLTGCHGSGDAIPNINNAAAFLDDNAVVRGPGMVTPRYGHTATVLGDGTVLVAGGTDERHLTSLDTAEIFDQGGGVDFGDPIPDTISGDFIDTDVDGDIMTLSQGGRIFHTATLLPDGNVLICGGTADALFAEAYETSEIYDIGSREFGPDALAIDPDLATPRFRHSATLLPNGKVLIAGGQESRNETIIDPNFAPGQPGFQITINVFPSLKSMEIYDPASRSFSPALTVTGQEAEFLSARGRVGHSSGALGGLDNELGTTDDIILHAGGFQTLSTIFAPQFKLPWQNDTDNSQNFEYYDVTTGDNRLAAGIVAQGRVNTPAMLNLGVVRDSTLAFDLSDPPDGEIDPLAGDIASVPGMTNLLVIANGDDDAPACPTAGGANDLVVATFTGFGPSDGLTFTVFNDTPGLTNNIENIVADPMNCGPFARSEADLVMVNTRRTYNGQVITTGVGVTAGGGFDFPTPNGCQETMVGTCSNGLVGVTIYDPFFNFLNDPPWDPTATINPITHPTGIFGTFINVDTSYTDDVIDNFGVAVDPLIQLAQAKCLHTLSVIPGEDGLLDTVDDRVVSIGGGVSYFPNYGDEPATISCEVILLPNTNEIIAP
ncbi:MAG: hypothetical protein CBC13_11205 [Planctomycetia bacterium TMED53]|nr:MAG: hypothetical protein CBC13_11205 [Planctomycetia bacterium TMED53]